MNGEKIMRKSRSGQSSHIAKTHLLQVREASADLARLQEREERDRNQRLALKWIAENRQIYAGQWIALRGNELLANGKTGKEVYSKVRGEWPPALVTKIEPDELPFGGR